MTFTPESQKQEAEPRGDIEVGDHLYVHHKGVPTAAIVRAQGRHGVTVEVEKEHHKVKWDKVLGHKKRAPQRYSVVDQGEDGMLVDDANGRRRYVGTPNESKEDPLVTKSHRELALFFKGGDPASRGLHKKVISDKRGVQTTRWVRTDAAGPPAQPGQHVGFTNGNHVGHGEVTAAGQHGVTVRDGGGGEHRIHHEKITHHWKGDGAPDAGPHNDSGSPPKLPDYAPRNEGENDKSYAKRVVDKGPDVNSLPEEHDKYFDTKDSQHVPLSNLHSTKSAEDNQQGGDNGPKRMLAAYHGKLGKRAPITVMPHESKPDHYEVVDGNGTLTSAQKLGWKGLPTKVVSRDEGAVQMMEDKLKDAVKEAKLQDLFGDPEYQSLPSPVSSKMKSWEDIEQAIPKAQSDFEDLLARFGAAIGGEKVDKFAEYDYSKPGVIFGFGPPKTKESAARKVNQKYGGNWGNLGDAVRGSIGFDSVEELRDGVEKLKAAGVKVAAKPSNKFAKPTDAGYRDLNLNIEMPNGVIGELQLHLKPILQAKTDGHRDYNVSRLLDAKAKNDPPLTEDEEKELQSRLLKQRSLYGEAMNKALSGKNNKQSSNMITKSFNRPTITLLFKKVVKK